MSNSLKAVIQFVTFFSATFGASTIVFFMSKITRGSLVVQATKKNKVKKITIPILTLDP